MRPVSDSAAYWVKMLQKKGSWWHIFCQCHNVHTANCSAPRESNTPLSVPPIMTVCACESTDAGERARAKEARPKLSQSGVGRLQGLTYLERALSRKK